MIMDICKDFVVEYNVLTEYVGNQTSVVIPAGVKVIGKKAFYGNTKIVEVIIPESVDIIKEDAFSGCTNLEHVTMPAEMSSIEMYAFDGCCSLKNVTIPKGIEELDLKVFSGCSMIEKISVPNGVKTIWGEAFSNCTGLTEVYIPESVEDIDVSAFDNCRNLINIDIPVVTWNKLSVACKKKIANDAAVEAFLNNTPQCGNMQKAIIAQLGKKEYKEKILSDCIKNNQRDKLVKYISSTKKSLSINELDALIDKATKEHSKIIDVLLNYKDNHYSKNDIEENAASNRDKTLGIKPRSVAEWRKIYSFIYVDGGVGIKSYLGDEETVSVPDYIGKQKVVEIVSWSYGNSYNVKNLYLPDGLLRIGREAFCGCRQLEKLYIPKTTEVFGGTFRMCPKLTIYSGAGSDSEHVAKIDKVRFSPIET